MFEYKLHNGFTYYLIFYICSFPGSSPSAMLEKHLADGISVEKLVRAST